MGVENILTSKYYVTLEKAYKDTTKPIIVSGPIDCGKETAIKQLCFNEGKTPYIVNQPANANEMFGFLDANGEYKASPLFNAYVTGQVFVIKDIKKITKSLLSVVLKITNSDKLKFACGEVNKKDGFRIILTTPITNMQTNDNFKVVRFFYDMKLESKLCTDASFVKLLMAMRDIASSNGIDIKITTKSFDDVEKIRKIKAEKDITIIENIIAPLTKTEVRILFKELEKNNVSRRFLTFIRLFL